MSKKKSYADKYDCSKVNIADLEGIVIKAYRNRIPLALVGAAGIGKTTVINKAAEYLSKELSVKCNVVTMMLSQLSSEDIAGIPYPQTDKRTGEMVVKMLRLDALPKDGCGILFLDELNHADQHVQRATFQLIGERRIGDYILPEGYSIVAAMNPDDENYATSKPSPALRRRMAWIEVLFNATDFLRYAANRGWNPILVEFLRGKTGQILNEEALAAGKIFACPASWEKVNTLIADTRGTESLLDSRAIIAGLVGDSLAKELTKFYTSRVERIDPLKVFDSYSTDHVVRNKVLKAVSNGSLDQISEVINALVTYMVDVNPESPEFSKKSANLGKFFEDLNDDSASFFLSAMQTTFKARGTAYEKIPNKWIMGMTSSGNSSKLLTLLQTCSKVASEKAQIQKRA